VEPAVEASAAGLIGEPGATVRVRLTGAEISTGTLGFAVA
jgi:hypothetical protein